MPRTTSSSFTDALQGLLADVMVLGATPDADLDFVMQLRQMIMDRLAGDTQQEAAMMASSAGGPQMPPGGGPGEMSRGPMPPPDLAAMAGAGGPPV